MTDRYKHIRQALADMDIAAKARNGIAWRDAHARFVAHVPPDIIRELLKERDVKEVKIQELKNVCGEAYQVIGLLLLKQGLFQSEKAQKLMDNLSQFRQVHHDVLPWPEVEAASPDVNNFIATFRCEGNGIIGSLPAKIHSVNLHDDGVTEVVIDHWPQQVEVEQLRNALRYVVRVWVLSDEINWNDEEVDKVVEDIIKETQKGKQ